MVKKLRGALKMLKNFVTRLVKSSANVHGVRNSHSAPIRNIGADAYSWFASTEATIENVKDISNVIDHQKWTCSEKLIDIDSSYVDYKKDNVELELHTHDVIGISLKASGEGSKEKLEAIKKEFDKIKA